jgi:hypothetical protein
MGKDKKYQFGSRIILLLKMKIKIKIKIQYIQEKTSNKGWKELQSKYKKQQVIATNWN